MKVLLVTSWDEACGIAEHAALLKEAVEKADPEIEIVPCPEALDPHARNPHPVGFFDLIHLNYQAALHSRWTPKIIRSTREHQNYPRQTPVVVTYHDTGVPNSDQCKAICAAADYYVVHEPCTDLTSNGEYLRQGVPAAEDPVYFDLLAAQMRREQVWWPGQPVVGTVGFPFPWKNYDLLCESAALAGWGVLLLAPTATPEQVARWRQLNPATAVLTDFTPRRQVVSYLSGCDATAFLYVCCNTGTSGAIRQGIAARKPVLAFSDRICRQFRDLAACELGQRGVRWLEDGRPEAVAEGLRSLPAGRLDYGVVALAQADSWTGVGSRYAAIYRQMLNRTQPEGK